MNIETLQKENEALKFLVEELQEINDNLKNGLAIKTERLERFEKLDDEAYQREWDNHFKLMREELIKRYGPGYMVKEEYQTILCSKCKCQAIPPIE